MSDVSCDIEILSGLPTDQGQDAETQEEAWKEGCTCQTQGINLYTQTGVQ